MSRKPNKSRNLDGVSQPPAPAPPEAEEVGYRKPPRRTQFKPGQSGT